MKGKEEGKGKKDGGSIKEEGERSRKEIGQM